MPTKTRPRTGPSTTLLRPAGNSTISRRATRQSLIACIALIALNFPATSSAAAIPAATEPTVADQELVVHTLANEGVALTDGRQTVLIDALFDEGVRGYRTLDRETQMRLIEGTLGLPPVALVLATHVHRDHFDANVVIDFLSRHPETRFIGPPQTVVALRSALRNHPRRTPPDQGRAPKLETRIQAMLPREGNLQELDRATLGSFDGKVTLLNLHHGRDRDPPTENLGILIEMAGLRALHIGDTEVRLADVDAIPWEELQIDIGLFPYWFLVKSHYLHVTGAIGPKHLVALHIPAEHAPASYFWPARTLGGLIESIRAEFPDAFQAIRSGERLSYSAESIR